MTRYKARPITPVDAVLWDGTNVADVQALCPEVEVAESAKILTIPTEAGPAEVFVGDYVMRSVGQPPKYSTQDSDVFMGLYEPQAT